MPVAEPAPLSIGIDFGTTNTVIAVADEDGRAEAVTFRHGEADLKGFVTALCYWQERAGGRVTTRVEGGPFAMDQLMAGGGPQRFIQSFKTFAASASFQETRIFGRTTRFEDLVVDFIGTASRRAGRPLDLERARVQIGRPVRFAGTNPDEALAMARYRSAFGRLGLTDAHYVYEPVGAAFFYARALDHDATVLVADFGGGTSDFSVMRFERRDGRLAATPLSHAGIGIAGDSFDYRIVDAMVSPALGKGSSYRSLDKVLTVPNRYYANLARWHQLAMMKSNGDLAGLRDLEKVALEPGRCAASSTSSTTTSASPSTGPCRTPRWRCPRRMRRSSVSSPTTFRSPAASPAPISNPGSPRTWRASARPWTRRSPAPASPRRPSTGCSSPAAPPSCRPSAASSPTASMPSASPRPTSSNRSPMASP